ncbi:DUF4249 family protein [Sunxiuqinia sp. A32]|uniref:DUF4249 family protein n=1 Tax=Sunxiuqinia sp. A32 TaxID=3461496 RepID=UPI0040459E6E
MKQYILPVVALFLLALTSCEDVIEVKLSDEVVDLYAVEAKITTESNPYVFLYKSLKVNEAVSYPGASGATVIISDNSEPQNSVQLEESSETNGLYLVPEGVDFLGEVNTEYSISIEHEGVTIIGSDYLSEVEPIDSIQVRPSLRGDKRFLGVFTYGDEPAGIGDYYKWDLYISGELLYEAEYMFVASDELVDGNYVSSLEVFTDFHDPDKPEDRLIKLGDSIQVKQTSISEFAYNYYYQMVNQNFSGGLFSVPPANIKGNLTASDGRPVLGLFTAHDVSVSNVVMVDEDIESQLRD